MKLDFYAIDKTAEATTHSDAEYFHNQCCHSEGSAPCDWCGGADWYCCDMKKVHDKAYPIDDKCANVEIINGSTHFRHKSYFQQVQKYRCAKLRSSSKPSAPPTTMAPAAPATTVTPQANSKAAGLDALKKLTKKVDKLESKVEVVIKNVR